MGKVSYKDVGALLIESISLSLVMVMLFFWVLC